MDRKSVQADRERILQFVDQDQAKRVCEDLTIYLDLLQRWQRIQNLVSRETLAMAWDRHFVDSLQALQYLKGPKIIDLGSGGGLPAIPLAIASKGSDRFFTLMEPNARKAAFLRTVSREIGLEIHVVTARADTLDSRETSVTTVTSRALAKLVTLLDWTNKLHAHHPRFVFHKGREHSEEIIEASQHYAFDVLTVPSVTDEGAAILVLDNIRRHDRA